MAKLLKLKLSASPEVEGLELVTIGLVTDGDGNIVSETHTMENGQKRTKVFASIADERFPELQADSFRIGNGKIFLYNEDTPVPRLELSVFTKPGANPLSFFPNGVQAYVRSFDGQLAAVQFKNTGNLVIPASLSVNPENGIDWFEQQYTILTSQQYGGVVVVVAEIDKPVETKKVVAQQLPKRKVSTNATIERSENEV